MGRPPTPVGSWGKITTYERRAGVIVAKTRFREYNGELVTVTAQGPSASAAARELTQRLLARVAESPASGDVTPDTRMSQLGALWLEEITDQERLRDQTLAHYRRTVERVINPALGELRLRDVKVGQVDRFLRALARERPAQAKMAKAVLNQVLNLAERHHAISYNPVASVKHLRTSRSENRALEPLQLQEVRRLVREWRTGESVLGPRPNGDLADIVDLLAGTGLRIGEVLALRWCDVDFSSDKVTITVNGTMVSIRGKGYFRQPEPKSRSGRRTLTLPGFAANVLLGRRVTCPPNELGAVFATRNGTWVHDHNVRRSLRAALAGTDYAWVSTRTFRKTVATVIDKDVDAKSASRQLGHAHESTTEGHYIARSELAPDLSEILERNLGPLLGDGS